MNSVNSLKGAASPGRRTPFGEASFWLSVALGTVLSLVFTGNAFPDGNTVYHLPIIGRLYDDPAFADNTFIQSLRYFSSGLWMLLAGSDRWIDPGILFFVSLALSRALTFVGFLLCADHLGLTRGRERVLFAVLIATIALMQNESLGGTGALFVPNFTHSEVPNGLFLIALWGLLQGRLLLVACLAGPIFFLNAFYSVWVVFVLGFAVAGELVARRLSIRQLLVPVAAGAVVGAVCAAPVLLNALANPGFGQPLDFSFRSFLEYRYPNHFLFEAISLKHRIGLLVILLTAVLALRRLPDDRRRLALVLAGIVGLYGIGIGVSYATDSRLILNLHLLRSGVLLHLLASLLVCTVVVRWFFSSDGYAVALSAAILAVAALDIRLSCFLIAAAFLADAVAGPGIKERAAGVAGPGTRLIRLLALGLLVLAAGAMSWQNHVRIAREATWKTEWNAVALWAKEHTPPGSTFLTPVFAMTKAYPGQEEQRTGASANAAFEYLSGRSIWADFKRGAYILWAPSNYAEWHRRVDAVERLSTHEEKMHYAVDHHIPYVVELTEGDCPPDSIFRTRRLCVSATPLP